MKIDAGSIVLKDGCYRYVARKAGKTRVYRLETADRDEALRRARALLPSPESEEEWLAYLSRLGRRAEEALRRRRLARLLTWRNLAETALPLLDVAGDTPARTSHRRWLEILRGEAEGGGGGKRTGPAELTRAQAEELVRRLAPKYVSLRRMVDFYRKCWAALELDPAVWSLREPLRRAIAESAREHDFYRRLAAAEIASLHAYLSRKNPFLADMVEIGYCTGLRLSDVAQLELAELSGDGRSLLIVPNKTRRAKPRPLAIPLVHGALAAVARLAAAARERSRAIRAGGGCAEGSGGGDGRLFPAKVRARPSKSITAAFRACGIKRSGCARASFHSLRATFISLMDEAGVPPHLTDSVTGHGGGGMHARYTQPAPAAVRAAMERAIPPLPRHAP